MTPGPGRTHSFAMHDDGQGRGLDREFLRFRDHGSAEALARVFDALAPRLLLVAGHLTHDAGRAEDLVQTTFLQAMRAAQRYDGGRPIGAWLAGILRHRAIDARRRGDVRHLAPLDGVEDGSLALDPAELAGDREFYERVVAAVLALDEPYRAVLNLRVVHGLQPTAIAHALGRKPGTVRMQLKRGLEELRRAVPAQGLWLAFGDGAAGLAAVRRAVLGATAPTPSTPIPPATSAAPATMALGGILTMKTFLSLLSASVAAVALFWIARAVMRGEPVAPRSAVGGEVALADEPVPALVEPERLAADRGAGRVQAAAESSVAAPEPAGLEVVVTFASDGAPARDVGVYLRAAKGGALGVEQRTDAAGIARFAPSDAGIHEAYVDRVSSPAAARWPEESSLAIEIPAGPRVEGRVVDLSGEGVAGALVLRRNDRHHDVLQRVAVADGEGRFALRDVEEKLELLARAPRHQPSELKDVKSRDGLAEVELRLGANGHALAGRVLMPGGDPAPFAWVLAGVDEDARRAPAGSDRDPLAKTGKPLDREGLLLRADAEGRFESDEIPGGHLLLVARSAADQETALLGWTTRFVAADVADELVVHLQPGGRITGIVRDATGMPVGGVALEAEWEGTRELGQMEDDLGPFVSDLRTVAAEDGSFRLGALLPGDYDLRVHGRYAELARHEQVLGVAEHAVWDPVVERPCALDVRVLDADGAPLSGWAVAASVDSGRRFHDAERSFTDERGLARLDDLPLDADVVVAAYPAADGACAELPAAWSTGVRVERPPTELVLRVASDRMPSASIRGRFLGADGAPVPGARVELALDGWGGAWSRAPDSDGRFAFAGLGAGRYVLRASTRELPRGFVLAEVDLAAGETLDVGG